MRESIQFLRAVPRAECNGVQGTYWRKCMLSQVLLSRLVFFLIFTVMKSFLSGTIQKEWRKWNPFFPSVSRIGICFLILLSLWHEWIHCLTQQDECSDSYMIGSGFSSIVRIHSYLSFFIGNTGKISFSIGRFWGVYFLISFKLCNFVLLMFFVIWYYLLFYITFNLLHYRLFEYNILWYII